MMENNPSKRKLPLDFELEKRLTDSKERLSLLKHTEERINALKMYVRKGVSEGDFKNLGVLLRGYEALKNVLSKKQGATQ